MIETERLNIRIASDNEMKEIINAEPIEEMKIAYGEMLSGCLRYPGQRQWYAVWLIYSKGGEKIGYLCFKGVSTDGVTEIGYGILPKFCGNGYATEAVGTVVKWALNQPEIKSVIAETDIENIASQKVLKKIGFKATGQIGEEGPIFAIKSKNR